jgi:phosphoglucomutase
MNVENEVVKRDWGTYQLLEEGPGFTIKKIVILPGKQSYRHTHQYRSEHWSIISGTATVSLGSLVEIYKEHESITIPIGINHRVANDTEQNLEFIEVSIGPSAVQEDKLYEYMQAYNEWCTDSYFDHKTHGELDTIRDDHAEIEDRFYQELTFGTGGLRGLVGAGTNRMNIYTVRKATQGLANYITEQQGSQDGVVIAYDSRFRSVEMAKETALCLNANGIKTYLFDSLRPTPELSFAVRYLGCTAGVVITASHNPAEYNGYKVYWRDGGQIVSPHDQQIIKRVNELQGYTDVKVMDEKSAKAAGLHHIIGKEIDDAYIKEIKQLVLCMDAIDQEANHMKIVYTPLHGTGNVLVQRVLRELGFTNVYVVKEQEQPDSAFPTVVSPNPENKEAFTMALELAKEVDADIVLATDPDADRLGVYVKSGDSYCALTGNMTGVLLLDYVLSQLKNKNNLPVNSAVVKTIISSQMGYAIADNYGVDMVETLTGFKYIGEQMKLFEEKQEHEFIFGYEESYGCLYGKHARDKDAVVAVMLLCEAAAYYRSIGHTLWEQMNYLYEKYGYYLEGQKSITLKGIDGLNRSKKIMTDLRENAPETIGDYQVLRIRDYQQDIIQDMKNESVSRTHLPKSNVLYYELSDQAWLCIRPSGTEPKIKIYYGIWAKTKLEAKKEQKRIEAILNQKNAN